MNIDPETPKRNDCITPFNAEEAEENFRAYCKEQGVDLDKLLEEAGKAFAHHSLDAEPRKLTEEEIRAWVEYEMSVDDWGRPLDQPKPKETKIWVPEDGPSDSE